ncbi:MAG: hypothetical protein C0394_03335 [Syntrophus sp. (in: bacteria)]|nr:hypothetical protein [Syntrophus sp. (in: bacteria)]
MGNEQFPGLRWPVMMKAELNVYQKGLLYLLLALALMVLVWPVHCLVVEDARSGTVVWRRFVQPGDRFVLMYRHSVELCHVWDHFQIDGEYGLVLDETVFPSSNTGLPAALGDGERLVREENGFRISNMRRILPAIDIWVDRRYDNTLIFGAQHIRLPELAGNTLLRLKTKQVISADFACYKLHSFFMNSQKVKK